jgi:hypothetical protein
MRLPISRREQRKDSQFAKHNSEKNGREVCTRMRVQRCRLVGDSHNAEMRCVGGMGFVYAFPELEPPATSACAQSHVRVRSAHVTCAPRPAQHFADRLLPHFSSRPRSASNRHTATSPFSPQALLLRAPSVSQLTERVLDRKGDCDSRRAEPFLATSIPRLRP